MAQQAQAKPAKATPAHRIAIEPSPKRVRVVFNGETIADSTHVLLLRETPLTPVYYFPRQDVRMDLLRRTAHSTHCPFKGDASYWTLAVGDRSAENALWGYEDPIDAVADIKDHVAFYWKKMDAWYEEDEEIFVHPRDPHVRIDVLASSRPVRVVLAGETVAETRQARFLFETGLPTRYYLPKEDVRMELLEPSDKHTACPYKGTASYWSVRIGHEFFEDLVWYYPDPLPEVMKIQDYLAFYNDRVEALYVDGKPVAVNP